MLYYIPAEERIINEHHCFRVTFVKIVLPLLKIGESESEESPSLT